MNRRRCREMALRILYQMDITRDATLTSDKFPQFSRELSESAKKFTSELVEGTINHLEELDGIIRKYSLHWSLERMFIIDRNILRMAIYELKYMDDIPPRVTINEAIEIAKRYGTEDSFSFVNGILDQVLNEKATKPTQQSEE